MEKYIRLLRMKHYIKNILVILPMFFGGAFLDTGLWIVAALGFLSFCAVSSAIYIINDIADADRDRLHPEKKKRPIASGEVSVKSASVVAAVCLALSAIFFYVMTGMGAAGYSYGAMLLLAYLAINVAYSRGLKNVPILDVVILAFGYVVRVYFGGLITGIEVSDWLFLVITAGALYMGFGKRRGELIRGGDTREVLKSYTEGFLNGSVTLMMGLTIVFYALWARDISKKGMIFSVPLFIVIMLRYGMVSDKKADGDPVEVILSDLPLMALLVVYGIAVSLILYM
ncbi:MAG: decaprenyl-phosphate phosphoribosyltransferase [Lachnospiraceae bacterium]|nr:decaprenyl-phosphate phosphoribosyltransferase [Lachnospiraceae bacterium]